MRARTCTRTHQHAWLWANTFSCSYTRTRVCTHEHSCSDAHAVMFLCPNDTRAHRHTDTGTHTCVQTHSHMCHMHVEAPPSQATLAGPPAPLRTRPRPFPDPAGSHQAVSRSEFQVGRQGLCSRPGLGTWPWAARCPVGRGRDASAGPESAQPQCRGHQDAPASPCTQGPGQPWGTSGAPCSPAQTPGPGRSLENRPPRPTTLSPPQIPDLVHVSPDKHLLDISCLAPARLCH